MLNIHGPPRAGKSAVEALFEVFFGRVEEDGYGAGLPADKVQVAPGRQGSAREGPQPFTHALQGARSVIVPELTRDMLDMDLLKALVEQEGGLIRTRECRGNVEGWNPSALIVTVWNYVINLGNRPVDGAARRVNVLAMAIRFAEIADPEAMVSCGDFQLKTRIRKGECFNDWFHCCAPFYLC